MESHKDLEFLIAICGKALESGELSDNDDLAEAVTCARDMFECMAQFVSEWREILETLPLEMAIEETQRDALFTFAELCDDLSFYIFKGEQL